MTTPQNEVLNPVDVEKRLRFLSNEIARFVKISSDAFAEFKRTQREHERAFAQAMLDATGAVEVRKQKARLEVYEYREALDVAEVAHEYAKARAQALRDELRATQSVGASVRGMYSVAGRGEW
ncbi:hypothetical protein [Corynebacterium aquilae]|uniref:Uncharacterized protein n=1 Tax=Corynebacterium aquilae DSM 44791 TaxID=1431546 RepID=A0A1L7CHJ7_9CORY|nr:hypothetical protein [Corynebacterium aquilae]APT85336.1 hypothetical protein CAQU_10000 [Corynebacterium aquilae DSM 44791]